MLKEYNRLKVVLAEKHRVKGAGKWLAEQLKVNEATVSRWVQNKQQPDLPTLYRIAEILEVAPCDLLEKGSEVV